MLCGQKRRGFLALIVVILTVAGSIGLYYGYKWHNQRNYIKLYDAGIIRYLDMPPFGERLTDADRELIGNCRIAVGTSRDQTSLFFKSISDRYGFIFTPTEKGFTMEVRKNYRVVGEYSDEKLILDWDPVLNSKQKKEAQEKFAEEIARKAATPAD